MVLLISALGAGYALLWDLLFMDGWCDYITFLEWTQYGSIIKVEPCYSNTETTKNYALHRLLELS